MNKIAHYCQKCRAANEPNAPDCRECGTPLMIVNLPRSLRHENFEIPSFYENHLLERVSHLEYQLSQMSEVLQTALELIRDQAECLRENRQVARQLSDFLNTNNLEIARTSPANTRENADRFNFERLIEQCRKHSKSQNPAIFEQLFNDALKSFEKSDEKQALLYLERALRLDPQNSQLILLLALRLLLADKFAQALEKLQTSKHIAAENPNIEFLQGIILADEGKFAAAAKLLLKTEKREVENFTLNYTRGFVFAALDKWKKAAESWERAARITAAPDIFYLIGCAYFQIEKYQNAFQEFEKAIAADDEFADAQFMQCLTLNEMNRPAEADQFLQTALQNGSGEAQCVEQYRKFQLARLTVALPFQHFAAKKRILTGGSQRLRKLFRSAVARDLQN